MASQAFQVDTSLALRPQSSAPTNPSDGEIYKDSVYGFLQYNSSTSTWIPILKAIVFKANVSNVTTTVANNPVIFDQVWFDTAGGYNSSTGVYKAPYSGYYKLDGTGFLTSSGPGGTFYFFNLTSNMSQILLTTVTTAYASGSTVLYANAGDSLSIDCQGITNLSSGAAFSIEFIGV